MQTHEIIESKSNHIIKELKSLSERKYRNQSGLFIADGLRFVNEIPKALPLKMTFRYTKSVPIPTSYQTGFSPT